MSKNPEPIVLVHGCAPGDITVLTALPRDIELAYPGRYEIWTSTHCQPLWNCNPHVVAHKGRPPAHIRQIKLDYSAYMPHKQRRKEHFITAFHQEFEKHEGIYVPCRYPKGDLHLEPEREHVAPLAGRYWVVFTGGKRDFTTKLWSAWRWQALVNALTASGLQIVQCGAEHHGHTNPPMQNVFNLVGKTDLRDILWVIKHAEGVICPITFPMHVAAALDKPCVCIAGGREHWWWEAYANVKNFQQFGPDAEAVKVPHRYLHTQDLLPCCTGKGCWKNKILAAQRDKHQAYCKLPVDDGFGQTIPACLDMISVDHVVEAVMSYYADGTLPPISRAVKKATRPSKRVDLFATDDEFEQTAAENVVQLLPLSKQVPVDDDPYDNPIIGGRFTVCALLYGDYPEMHKQCIGSIITSMPPYRRQLRIVCNQVCKETADWLIALAAEGEIYKLIFNNDNRKKYPAMRQLFHDPMDPITDKWIIWFDDDSIANKDVRWHYKLAHKIIDMYPRGSRMTGALMYWAFSPTQQTWLRSRPWYTGVPFQTREGRATHNGVYFAAGGFWALETALMKKQNIPDPELGHNGGDYVVGAQVWQAGATVATWNSKKQFVFTSSVPRRGLHETHTAMPGWKPTAVTEYEPVTV